MKCIVYYKYWYILGENVENYSQSCKQSDYPSQCICPNGSSLSACCSLFSDVPQLCLFPPGTRYCEVVTEGNADPGLT